MIEIQVTLTHMFNGYGRRVPFSNYYECTGPDGKLYTNSSKATLADVLRRRYGKVKLVIDDRRKPVNEY